MHHGWAGIMGYDDSNWVQSLEAVGLTLDEYDDAILLLANKSPAYRQGMLGREKEANARVIRKALQGESSMRLSPIAGVSGALIWVALSLPPACTLFHPPARFRMRSLSCLPRTLPSFRHAWYAWYAANPLLTMVALPHLQLLHRGRHPRPRRQLRSAHRR